MAPGPVRSTALGAFTTAIVTIVIAVTKFTHGAWAVMVLRSRDGLLLVRMNHQYEREDAELGGDLVRLDADEVRRPIVVLLVEAFDRRRSHALQYAKTIRAEQTTAVHIEDDPDDDARAETAWGSAGLGDIPLHGATRAGDAGDRLAGFVAGCPPTRDVNILVPVSAPGVAVRATVGVARRRSSHPSAPPVRAGTVDARPGSPGGGAPADDGADGQATVRVLPRRRPTRSSSSSTARPRDPPRHPLRAVAGRERGFAIHAGVDPAIAAVAGGGWMTQHLPIPLDLRRVLGPQRRPRARAGRLRLSGRHEVTVVMPRRDFPHFRQRMLARPHEPEDRQGARSLPACRRGDRPVLLRSPPSARRLDMARRGRREVGSAPMQVIIMGCGRVASELSLELSKAVTMSPSSTRSRRRSSGTRPATTPRRSWAWVRSRCARGRRDQGGGRIRRSVERRQLEHRVGPGRARALPRSEGDRPDLRPAARRDLRAAEHPDGRDDHVGREADQADAFPRSPGGPREHRRRRPRAAARPGAAPSGRQAGEHVNIDGKLLVAGVSRGGGGFIPTADTTFQEGDYLAVIMAKDGMDLLDEIWPAPRSTH